MTSTPAPRTRDLPVDPAAPEVFERSIPARFSEVAQRDPQATALLCEGTSLSFGELELAARRLAGGLIARLGTGHRPVAVALPLGIPAIVAMLGVMRAGKVFAPADARLDASAIIGIEQFGAECVICEAAAIQRLTLRAGTVSVVAYEDLLSAGPQADLGSRPDDAATILTTSGSEGRPKGVTRSHRCELHASLAAAAGLGIGPQDRLSLMGPLKFGANIWWALTALLSGASAQLHDLAVNGLLGLSSAIARAEVTAMLLIPSVLREFVAIAHPVDLRTVRIVIMGGERLLPTDLDAVRRVFPPHCMLVHALGATEVPMIAWSLCGQSGSDELALEPFPDTLVQIVGEDGTCVEPGESGELLVSGRYLASGYWKDPLLTATRFRPIAGGCASYRTGDRGWFGDQGRLHLGGRLDRQVKLRGQRVELEAVEAAILGLPGVKTTAVAVRETARRSQLVAYVVPADGVEAIAPSEIQAGLRGILSDGAIPSSIVVVDDLPTLPSGKLDRAAIERAAGALQRP